MNFELILNGIGTQGTLVDTDCIAKILDRAREKADRQSWANVHLLQRDVRQLVRSDFETLTGGGGRYCVMDLFNDKVTLQTRIVNLLANSDISC